jgi:hypothetical protein
VCCSYSVIGIATALKSVARTRLEKTKNINVCVCVGVWVCKVEL